MDLVSSCRDKLAYFRIKELRDILTQLGLAKQGRKQDMVDRISMLLSDDQVSTSHGWGKRNFIGKEGVAKIIDDTYRKMRDPGASDLASRSTSCSDLNHVKPKEEAVDSYQLDMKVRCPCGSPLITESMIKCEDPRCHVWQHIGCVPIPEKPAEGVSAEVQPHFYCEICRINRADPFWVTIAHPMLPLKLACGSLAADGTNAVQTVEKTFQLSRADREMLQRAEFELQVWCILLDDKVPFRMQWPQCADLQVNGIPVRTTNRPGSQSLGINGRDDGPTITTCSREGTNKICLSRCDARIFCIGIRIGRRRTVQQVLNLVPKEADGECFEDALTRVCRCIGGGTATDSAESDSDLEVVADSVTVNLRCPMGGSRIKVAGRFKPCVHMRCFDLETFVEHNQRSRKWQCPICLKNYSLGNIIIDPYFNCITSLMRYCGEDVNEIEVKPDGSWRCKNEGEYKDLAQWHLPDGSLCPTTGAESKPNLEVLKQVKEEDNCEGQTCLKLGIKKNNNGLREVGQSEEMRPPSSGNRVLGKFENHIQKIVATSSSTTGNYRNREDPCVNQEGGGQFDFLIGNGHELDSLSLGFNPPYDVEDGIPPAPTKDADIIILSDSDDDNIMMISPDAAPGRSSGIPFSANNPGVRYTEDTGGGTSGAPCHDLFNNNGDDFSTSLWSLQTCPETGAGFHLFDMAADVSGAVVNASSSLCSGPIRDYNLGSNVGFCNAPQAQDHSTNHPNIETNGILADNPLPFGSNGTSLQSFFQTRPASVPMHANTSERSIVPNETYSDDLLSLSLAAGGDSSSNGLNLRQQFTQKEGKMDSSASTASLLLGTDIDGAKKTSSKSCKRDYFLSVPRQPRSVRPRRSYLSIDTDSD